MVSLDTDMHSTAGAVERVKSLKVFISSLTLSLLFSSVALGI